MDNLYRYLYSCDLTSVNVKLKVGSLEGYDGPCHSPQEILSDPLLKFSGADPHISAQIYADERPLSVARETQRKSFQGGPVAWNEWLTLPVKFSDLPREAVLAITVWDIYGCGDRKPIGGTSISLFGKNLEYRSGMYDLRVWRDVEADGSSENKTPGKTSAGESADDAELCRLMRLRKQYRSGRILRIDWQDRLALKELEVRIDEAKRRSQYLYLNVEFQSFFFEDKSYSVVYYEPDADNLYQMRPLPEIVICPDLEIGRPNLAEEKHHLLTRGTQSGRAYRELKPNAEQRNHLNRILEYPPTEQLSSEDKDLVWKYRFYLSNQSRALPKFLRCVDWQLEREAQQAVEFMSSWAPIDALDALELLSPDFRGVRSVRKYAVQRLRQADDEELILFLLQLVQALRYEDFQEIFNPQIYSSSGASFSTVDTSSRHSTMMESSSRRSTRLESDTSELQDSNIEDLLAKAVIEDSVPLENQEDLSSFLIHRAVANPQLGNSFFWYLTLESSEQRETATPQQRKVHKMYQTVLKRFSEALKGGNLDHRLLRSQLNSQATLISELSKVMQQVNASGGNRKHKIDKLRRLLRDGDDSLKIQLENFDNIPFPLDPSVLICGIEVNEATLFKSNLSPAKLTFLSSTGERYVAIFKHGDDLRQDQLVLQMIQLIDKLLSQENLDLKLTPYRVLATSRNTGLMQFVESEALASVLQHNEYSTLQHYLRKHAPDPNGPYGIKKEVLDTYVRSCAGYCIATYILGVGDRHLDNLLLTTSGRLFHVDFGYILGRDPKPMPPPMKLSKEMVDCMGGVHSTHFAEFKSHCYNAFIQLRRKAGLFLNLFSLMVDANIPDIALEPDKAVKKVRDRFRLEMSDEECVVMVQHLVEISVNSVMPLVMDRMHSFAQLWR